MEICYSCAVDKFLNYVSPTGKKYDFAMILPIRKVEEQSDGTLRVYGIVTTQKPDRDKEVCNYVKTVPYYKKTVAEMLKATDVEGMEQSIMPLREMHQLNAVGKGISINFLDEEKTIYMGFEVVAAETIKKVKKGVLPAFSQGGNYAEKLGESKEFPGCIEYVADPGEVSLVDRGSLPQALIDNMKGQSFSLHKRDGSVEIVKCGDPSEKTLAKISDEDVTRLSDALAKSLRAHKTMREVQGFGESFKANFKKGMYTVSQVAEILDRLTWIQESLILEREQEGDESEAADSLGTIVEDLVSFFRNLVVEETQELLGGIGKMNKDQIAKCAAALGIAVEEFENKFVQGDALEKGKKGLAALHAHLKKAVASQEKLQEHHKAGTEMHKALGEHLQNCMKAHGACQDGEEAEKILKALVSETEKKDEPKAEAFTKVDAQKMVYDALVKHKVEFDKQLEKTLAPNNGGTGASLNPPIGRDGNPLSKAVASNDPIPI
jgi:hypothetical protein